MIESQLEIIDQGRRFLKALDQQQYCHVATPHFNRSAGAHMRHIIDHYQALMGRQNNLVDYNKRHRFSEVETSIDAALQALSEVEQWLLALDQQTLNQSLDVLCEISVSEQQNHCSRSTLGRELVFVSSHAVHHFFTLKLIANLQGIIVTHDFGLAPATASFERSQAMS